MLPPNKCSSKHSSKTIYCSPVVYHSLNVRLLCHSRGQENKHCVSSLQCMPKQAETQEPFASARQWNLGLSLHLTGIWVKKHLVIQAIKTNQQKKPASQSLFKQPSLCSYLTADFYTKRANQDGQKSFKHCFHLKI